MNTFTKGILKVFTHPGYYKDLNDLCTIANIAGFSACAHNGTIYIKTTEGWTESPFEIWDFNTQST